MLPEKITKAISDHRDEGSFYLYDRKRMLTQISRLDVLPENVRVYYAMKANPNPEVVKICTKNKMTAGVEIASGGEAEICTQVLGDSLNSVIYTGPGKTRAELKFCVERGIRLINIESLTEAHRINSLVSTGKRQDILLRVNPDREIHGAKIKMCSKENPGPFGVEESRVMDTIARINALPALNLCGLHVYSATGVLDCLDLIENVRYIFTFAQKVQNECGVEFPVLDLGGGFGIDYEGQSEFDIESYSVELSKLIKEYGFEGKELILELGRYITADMGYFASRINDIKSSHGTKILVCHSGVNAHRRPAALNIEYPITVAAMGVEPEYNGQPSVSSETVQIRGPLCTPVDILSRGVFLEKARIGDYIVMAKAGAYGLTMSVSDFLSHPRVNEYVI